MRINKKGFNRNRIILVKNIAPEIFGANKKR